MKKKITTLLCCLCLLVILSTNASAKYVQEVLTYTCDAYTILFNIHIKHVESYEEITYANGYDMSTDTKEYNDGKIYSSEVFYKYRTY